MKVHVLIRRVAQFLSASFDKAMEDGGNQRIMLVNRPSNPTGQVYTKEVMEMIATFCKHNNITLIGDEIYSDIRFTGSLLINIDAESRLDNAKIVLTDRLPKV